MSVANSLPNLAPFVTNPAPGYISIVSMSIGDDKSDSKIQNGGLMRHWGDFGRVVRQLWTGDFNSGYKLGFTKQLESNVGVKSELNFEDSSLLNSISLDAGILGHGKLGANVAIDPQAGGPSGIGRPSSFMKWTCDSVDQQYHGAVTARVNKAWWRPELFWSVDVKNQFPNLAIATQIGSNPGEKMIKRPENLPRDNWPITSSVTVGSGPFAIGGQIKSEGCSYGGPLIDYNVGFDWARDRYGFGFRTKEQTRRLVATMWGDIKSNIPEAKFQVGSFYSWDRKENEAVAGLVLQLSGAERFRWKIKGDTQGAFGVSFSHKPTIPDTPADCRFHVNVTANPKLNQFQGGVALSIGDF
jgi:hypothetical protein